MNETIDDVALRELNERFQNEPPESLLAWASEKFGKELLVACSFGAEDVVLVDMMRRTTDDPQIFYLDTNKHFKETYQTRDRLTEKYGIQFIQVEPKLSLEEQARQYGDRLWERDPNRCCFIRKVEPLREALQKAKAWVTGIRREQSYTRANARLIEWDDRFGLIKINPLAFWSWDDVWNYIRERGVPYNSLHDQNYPSIGCEVCTKPVKDGEDPRSGRWAGSMKVECGLHLDHREGLS